MTLAVEKLAPGVHRLVGELAPEDAATLRALLPTLACDPDGRTVLELSELEIPSGPALAALVDALRALLDDGRVLALARAPQSLAHVLYRTGMLGRFALVDARTDEPSAP